MLKNDNLYEPCRRLLYEVEHDAVPKDTVVVNREAWIQFLKKNAAPLNEKISGAYFQLSDLVKTCQSKRAKLYIEVSGATHLVKNVVPYDRHSGIQEVHVHSRTVQLKKGVHVKLVIANWSKETRESCDVKLVGDAPQLIGFGYAQITGTPTKKLGTWMKYHSISTAPGSKIAAGFQFL